MDVFEIEIEACVFYSRWYVTHNGHRIAQGSETTDAMALEKAQHAIDIAYALSRLAA